MNRNCIGISRSGRLTTQSGFELGSGMTIYLRGRQLPEFMINNRHCSIRHDRHLLQLGLARQEADETGCPRYKMWLVFWAIALYSLNLAHISNNGVKTIRKQVCFHRSRLHSNWLHTTVLVGWLAVDWLHSVSLHTQVGSGQIRSG